MKRHMYTLVAVLCLCLTASAQETFYYSGNEKIVLTQVPGKYVGISPLQAKVSPALSGFTPVDTVSDDKSRICVYECSPQSAARMDAGVSRPAGLQPCYVDEQGLELVPTGYLYVRLKSASNYPILVDVANQHGLEIVEQNRFMPLWYTLRMIEVADKSPVDVANEVYELGLFASVTPDFSFDAREISYDSDVTEQWGLYNSEHEGYDISVSPAWDYATGRGVKIAIVDEGIELTHSDLAANIYNLSYDTETGTSPSKVYGDHGTHCAGIAAAVRNNGRYITGVAPDAKLMSVSNELMSGSTFESEMADGINWAWKNGADIISCSWRSNKSSILEEAIDSALTYGRNGKGCIIVKSAGNTGGAITYPGNYRKEILAVANMTITGALSFDSAYGESLFVAAPGQGILSTVRNDTIGSKNGTSMAAPHVAGLAALILERNPNLTAEQVREIIARNTKKIGEYKYDKVKEFGTWNEHYGYGLIDAYKAVINTPRNQ